MRVDAHVHVWRAVTTPGAHGATIVSGECDIPVELLLAYLDEHAIDRAVLVQPIYPGTDNVYIADCAARNPKRLASVCVVDPRLSDAADQLRYWVTERGCRGLRLRPRVAAESAIFGDESTWPLWQAARELGVVVSVLASPEHLRTIGDMAERFAPVEIVLDHFAHPTWLDSAPWEISDLIALARCPNVYVKTSGYHYFSRDRYPYAESRALVAAVLDAFGPDRLLWGSDFPHVLLRAGYGRNLRLVAGDTFGQERHANGDDNHETDVDLFSGRLSIADRKKILGENARRLYWPAGE
jgi:L-fuconolactonase